MPPGGGFTQLLGCPSISRGEGNGRMDNLSRLKFHENQDVDKLEKQGVDCGEITSPDISSVILQESGPILARISLSHLAHIAFDSALVDIYP